MTDMCDSSGCLPGQTPMPGQKPHSVLASNADQTMMQVVRPNARFFPQERAKSVATEDGS